MMDESQGLDIPIIRLRPLRERKVPKRAYDKILASIKAIGLLEPLVVYPEGDDYVILDGAQRYRALLELGVEIVPCILGQRRETFTSDRMVNQATVWLVNLRLPYDLEPAERDPSGDRPPAERGDCRPDRDTAARQHDAGRNPRPRHTHAPHRANHLRPKVSKQNSSVRSLKQIGHLHRNCY